MARILAAQGSVLCPQIPQIPCRSLERVRYEMMGIRIVVELT